MSIIADIVVTSATAAFAHFGVTMDAPERHPAPVERTVTRSQSARPQPQSLAKPGGAPAKAARPPAPAEALA